MNYNNEFDETSRGGFLANVGPKAAFFIVLIALSFMMGVVWKLYSGAGNADPKNVPIVRADDVPFKVVPDDPRGMEIRHKDSTLFSSIKKEREENAGRIENLLADDENEEPMPRSQLFAGLNTEPNTDLERNEEAPTPLDQPLVDVETNKIEQSEPTSEQIAEPLIESIVESEPAPEAPQDETPLEETIAPDPAPATKPVPKPVAKLEPAPAPVEVRTDSMPVASPQSSGEFYIQLASTKDKANADKEWKKLSQKYSVISGMNYRLETADLGDRGIFYRIQAGPVSKEEAQSKCGAIKKINPQGCLVKK